MSCVVRRQTFRIESAEGLPIHGVVESGDAPERLVFLLHGLKGFKEWGFFPWLGNMLAESGLAVCRFDFSHNGVSGGGDAFDRLDLFETDTYSIQLADLARVIEHVTTIPELAQLPVSLLGYSRGAAIALLGAATVPRLASVVTWSGISTLDRWDRATIEAFDRNGFTTILNSRTRQEMRVSRVIYDDYRANAGRLDVLAATRQLDVPLLVVHGAADETVSPHEAAKLAAAAADASLLMIERATHSFCSIHPLIHVPLQLSLAARVTERFLHK